jgi:hypothetical protein
MTREKKVRKHPNEMPEHDSKHFLERLVERCITNRTIKYIFSHFVIEYGFREHPKAEPRPLKNPHRRAFLVMGRGLQGVIFIIDATDTKAVKVTVIAIPHDEWGPLPERYRQYTSTVKK